MYRTPSLPLSISESISDTPLPKPATQPARKTARFDNGLRVHWARIKQHLNTGSALSESVLDATADSTEAGSTYRRYLEKNHKPSQSEPPVDDGPVDEIVVDNQFLVPGEKSATQPSEAGDKFPSAEQPNSHQHTTEPRLNSHGVPASDSYFEGTANSFWDRSPILIAFRYRVLPHIWRFFNLSFHDPEAEAHYLKERYYTKKRLAFFASLFFVLNWALALALIPRPLQIMDYVFYYGVSTALTLPGPFLIIFDGYRRFPVAYQIWLTLQTYMWAFYNLLYMHLCGYYGQHSYWTCGRRDFVGLLYFATGFPVLALFGMHQHRFPACISAVCLAVLIGVLVIPWRASWSRILINFILFQAFLLYLHFMYERAERRLFKLRDQLKTQYRATQKAQVSERKAADSKRRLTSYIFHEVRVPLNTALLATQNMAAETTLSREHDVEFNALEGSLSMMSKVLNDVLDFNRMDSGRFESVSKPYAFHTVMRSMLVPLQLAADARGLELVSELDPAINEAIRNANRLDQVKRALNNEATRELSEEEEIMVLGDEMRLRQIITNLASNAAKFTESGGKIFIRTKLITVPPRPNPLSTNSATSGVSGTSSMPTHNGEKGEATPQRSTQSSGEKHGEEGHSRERAIEHVVVRIEVEDTGVGIRRKDLADNKLFSAFNQTEVGRLQGGKGTGLGLALVRHIVRLSGGRLGVKSEREVGSTFWVELSLGVGRRVNNALARKWSKDDALTNIRRSHIVERSGLVLDASHGVGDHHDQDQTPGTSVSTPSELGFMPTLPVESSAALKTIMEHGGMVEIASRRPRSIHANEVPIVVTRSMGTADASIIANTAINSPTTAQETSKAPAHIAPPTLPPPDLAVTEPTPTVGTPVSTKERPGFVDLSLSKPFDSPLANNRSSSAGSSATAASGSGIGPNTLNVLVVDDDPLTRKLMTRMLTRLGCVCETAENGLLALEMLGGPMVSTPMTGDVPPSSSRSGSPANGAQTGSKYAVVFLDNQMPLCSGLEVMRQLRSLGRQDFVVGVTGNALKEDQEEYYEAGVDQVLTKPVLERSLKQMLVMADERRRAQRTPGATRS